MSVDSTRATMLRYFNAEHGDAGTLADDVVFTVMGTGEEHRGPQGVLAMIDDFYHVAFDATFATRTTIFGEHNAMTEGEMIGRHIGAYAGVPATGKDVRVPLCVVYDLADDKITRGRVYIELPVLLRQLGVPMP